MNTLYTNELELESIWFKELHVRQHEDINNDAAMTLQLADIFKEVLRTLTDPENIILDVYYKFSQVVN